MTLQRKIGMKIIDKIHPELNFVKSNSSPESHNNIMKYVIVLIVPHQYFQQVTHYQNEKDKEESENTLKLNPHHMFT